jgi:hypothetical protein
VDIKTASRRRPLQRHFAHSPTVSPRSAAKGKIYRHFPNWKLAYDLPRIIGEIVQAHRAA